MKFSDSHHNSYSAFPLLPSKALGISASSYSTCLGQTAP